MEDEDMIRLNIHIFYQQYLFIPEKHTLSPGTPKEPCEGVTESVHFRPQEKQQQINHNINNNICSEPPFYVGVLFLIIP